MMPQNVRHPNRVTVKKPGTDNLNTRAIFLISGLLLVLFVAPLSASAQGYSVQNSSFMLSQGGLLSPDEAAQRAKQGRDTKVLKVDKVKTPAGLVYRVKILTKKGRVKYVNVDAISGEVN